MKDFLNKFITHPSVYGSIYGALAGAHSGYMLWWRNKPINELNNMVYRGACMGAVIGSAAACLVDLSVARNKNNKE